MLPASRSRCAGTAGCVVVEFEAVDAGAALLQLAGRDQDVLDILRGLAEMRLQLQDAIVEPADIVHQDAHFLLDDMRLLAHLGVAQHRLDHLDRQQQQRGRDDDDAASDAPAARCPRSARGSSEKIDSDGTNMKAVSCVSQGIR